MFRKLLLVVIAALLVSCGNKGMKDDPLLVKAPSAEKVSELCQPFREGHYEEFIEKMHSAHDKSEAYRQQIVNMLKQHAAMTDSLHRGVVDVCVTEVVQSKAQPLYADAYLQVSYGNGSTERIILPLVYQDGKWWIK